MDRRIAPPSDYDELLDRLSEPHPGGQVALFQTRQKAVMFAAALGFNLGERTPLLRKGSAIRFDIFEKALDDGFVNALAVAETGELEVLAPERAEERAMIFEEYAHTGLREIQRRCYEDEGDPLQALVGLTESAQTRESGEVGGLSPGILKELLR